MRFLHFQLVVFTFALLFGQSTALAQRWEIGAGMGITHYKGEIYPNFKPLAFHGGTNAFVRYNLSKSLSFKGTAMVGYLAANDKRVNTIFHQERGFSFRNNVWDAGAQIEYNFQNFRTNDIYEKDWTPYLFAGFNAAKFFNRNFFVNNTIKELSDTYIPMKKVNTSANVIPFGFGIKKEVKDKINLSFEFGSRKTFDDIKIDRIGFTEDHLGNYQQSINQATSVFVKQSLSPNTRFQDMYFYTNISISYVFGNVICPNQKPVGGLINVKRKHRRR